MQLKFIESKAKKLLSKILSKRNALRHNTLFGLFLGFASVSVMFLMTGALYFRNEACIYDSGTDTVIRSFTMYDTLEEILDEQGIVVGENDRVDFNGVVGGEAEIVIHRAVKVPLIADGETVLVECAYDDTVEDVVLKSGVELEEMDVVKPESTTPCTEVEAVEVHRAYPVYVYADGETKELASFNETAAEVLERAGITLTEDDFIDCEPDTLIGEGETVKVSRVTYKTVETYETVPYSTVTQRSNLVSMYSSEVTQEGKNGTRTNTSLVKYIDGVRVSETAVSSMITEEPVSEIISAGAALTSPYSKKDSESLVLENGLPADYETVLTGKSCAYTAPLGSGTASGRKLEIGTVAVDPNIIPYGSELYIVSTDGSYVYGYAIAADTGFLTENGVLVDLFMGNSEDHYMDSVNYGAKQVNIYVLSWGA